MNAFRTKSFGAYRLAAATALATTLGLVWLSLGVGIIGADGDPANLLYAAVVAVGALGAIVSRLQPRGLARTLAAMAFTQATIAIIAVATGLGMPASPPLELVILNGFFIAAFGASAWMFHRAAHGNGSVAPR